MVGVSSLRQSLGLPFYDLFENSFYHVYAHSETLGADVEDTNHRASAVPQIE